LVDAVSQRAMEMHRIGQSGPWENARKELLVFIAQLEAMAEVLTDHCIHIGCKRLAADSPCLFREAGECDPGYETCEDARRAIGKASP
jgi:hypothetical protein